MNALILMTIFACNADLPPDVGCIAAPHAVHAYDTAAECQADGRRLMTETIAALDAQGIRWIPLFDCVLEDIGREI